MASESGHPPHSTPPPPLHWKGTRPELTALKVVVIQNFGQCTCHVGDFNMLGQPIEFHYCTGHEFLCEVDNPPQCNTRPHRMLAVRRMRKAYIKGEFIVHDVLIDTEFVRKAIRPNILAMP